MSYAVKKIWKDVAKEMYRALHPDQIDGLYSRDYRICIELAKAGFRRADTLTPAKKG